MTFKQKYPIRQMYLPVNTKRRSGNPLLSVQFMVAHDTGNPGSTAASNVQYFVDSCNEVEASAHIFVDDNEIVECIPFLTGSPEKAWHVQYQKPYDNQIFGMDANDATGGIELCYGGNICAEEAYKRYVWIFAYACWKHGVDPGRIAGHYMLDPERRTDPKPGLAVCGKTFAEFLADVANEYRICTSEEVKVASEGYPDVPADHWAAGAIQAVTRAGMMRGYPDGTFQPEKSVTRAELAKVVNDLLYKIEHR